MINNTARTHSDGGVLTPTELTHLHAWWRAANYLSVGQIYLMDNPLLREPLQPEHIKPRLLGHWGTTPGLNFIYAHLNRSIIIFKGWRARPSRGAGCGHRAASSLSGGDSGRRRANTAPRPGPGEVAVRVPPWASINALEMVRPIPDPPLSRLRAASPR